MPIASDCPRGFALRDGWCMPQVSTACPTGMHFVADLGCTADVQTATASVTPSIWQPLPGTAPIARLPGPGPESLQAEDLYVSGDYTAATESALKGCDAGDGFGCGLAGRMIGRGQGGLADLKRGALLLERGCSLGDPWSCTQMRP